MSLGTRHGKRTEREIMLRRTVPPPTSPSFRVMSAQFPASRSGDAPLRWRTKWGWGVFFALVFAGLVFFWLDGSSAPILHEVVSPR